MHTLFLASEIGLVLAAGIFALLAWRAGRRGRAGDPDAVLRIPRLLLTAFILLVLGSLARAADVALRTLR